MLLNPTVKPSLLNGQLLLRQMLNMRIKGLNGWRDKGRDVQGFYIII